MCKIVRQTEISEVPVHQSRACVPEMLSRLCAFFEGRRVLRLRAGFQEKISLLAFASSPIASVFFLCVIFVPLINFALYRYSCPLLLTASVQCPGTPHPLSFLTAKQACGGGGVGEVWGSGDTLSPPQTQPSGG